MKEPAIRRCARVIWAFYSEINALAPQASPPTSRTQSVEGIALDETDFGFFQDALADQNSRIDATEGTLGALAAIQVAVGTYMYDKTLGASHEWPETLRPWILALLIPIAVSLVAALMFPGDESPSMQVYHRKRKPRRAEALTEAIDSMNEAYGRNRKLISIKERARTSSLLFSGFAVGWCIFVIGLLK